MSRSETRAERLTYRWCGAAVLVATALCLARVAQTSGSGGLWELVRSAVVSLALLGKFVIFLGLQEGKPSPWVLAMMVWLIDLLIAFALASGLEGLERAPMLGRWLRRSRSRATEVLQSYPGLERMAVFGVVTFVMLPLAATGAVSGSFAARLVGLSRLAGVGAIAAGSFGTSVSFALLAHLLGEKAEALAHSPLLIGTSLLAVLVIGRIAYGRITRKLRQG